MAKRRKIARDNYMTSGKHLMDEMIMNENGWWENAMLSWYSPILPLESVQIMWRWKIRRMTACDRTYDVMISDWERAHAEGVSICRRVWVGAIDTFVKRKETFISVQRETDLLMVLTTKNEIAMVKSEWLDRAFGRLKDESMLSELCRIGIWDNVVSFLFQSPLPQTEMSAYNLSFCESFTGVSFISDQTTSYLLTGNTPRLLCIHAPGDITRFISSIPDICVGMRMSIRTSKKRIPLECFRVHSIYPFMLQYESDIPLDSNESFEGFCLAPARVVLKPDITSLIAVNRETAFILRSSVRRQQRLRLFEMGRMEDSMATRPLNDSINIIKRITRTALRCNYEEVHNLQETYHFTPKNIGIISTVLCDGGIRGHGEIYYAGCGLGREVLAMSMSHPRHTFFANDLPGYGFVAVDSAALLRTHCVGFGLIAASQIDISSASMCSAYSECRQLPSNGVLYSTVTSLDILRGTLRRALFGGVQMICMLQHVAKPSGAPTGRTFDSAVTAAVDFALGGDMSHTIRTKMSTNIQGGGIVFYNFSTVTDEQRRLILSLILRDLW
jgi:hypothetical protein